MKNVLISLAALAAISTAAQASDRFNGERDTSAYVGFYSPKDNMQSPTVTKVSPLAIEDNARALTAFERMNKISEENENGSK
jgi:opacity protein-like surface antigen